MAASDFNALYSGPAQINRGAAIEKHEKRTAYVIAAAENPQDLTPGFIQTLVFKGVVFWYDSADATTAHDGTTCIVTADGKRFKSDQFRGANSRIVPVLDKDLTAPPGSPAIGASYIVAAGGSGAWAAKDKYFASWTARGWVFIVPNAFDIAYVRDEALFYYYSAGGVWTSGLPALTIADASISIRKFKYFGLGPVAVENQTTNAPPGSPADGVAYVVGGSPTGAWAGQSLKVAIYETAAWVFYTAYQGAEVYDKALEKYYKFNGATWETPPENTWVLIEKRVIASAVATADFTGLSAYKALRVTGINLVPATDNVNLLTRISSDGSTYLSSNYAGDVYTAVGSDTVKSAAASSGSFPISSPLGPSFLGVGNAAGDGGLDLQMIVKNFNQAQKTKCTAMFEFGDTSGALVHGILQSWHTAQTAMQALRLLFSSGNIASGTIVVEGLA